MVQIGPVESAPTERALEKKRQILQGASRVFRRRGLHAAGMREIAAELGMHAGNLYYYFDNKQELLAFCQVDALAGLLALAERVRAGSLPADEKLALLIAGHVELLNERTPGSLAHLEVEALASGWRERIQARRDAYERCYRELIREGMRAGVFRRHDPGVAALAILGALNWTVKWFRPEGARSAVQIGRDFAHILVRGLCAPGHEPRIPSEAKLRSFLDER